MQEQNDTVVTFVDAIFQNAIAQRASDIHIEPARTTCVVRFRVDGLLTEHTRFASELVLAVIARLKIMAGLRIDEQRRPQDGRIELVDERLSLRIATMPTLHGEKVALRVMHDERTAIMLDSLGFSQAQLDIVCGNIEKPYGLIAVCGPTGSGKTTTLYGMLSAVTQQQTNVVTLEDPIEMAIVGASQTQISTSVELGFASGLRALLRQDPDVIMVGEIRDAETASMVADAALTGHMILSTLHTNDAPSALVRFLDMGVDDFVVASMCNLIISQRLVRKVCDQCSIEREVEKEVLVKLSERVDIVVALERAKLSMEELATMQFAQGQGCDSCRMTGFHGRVPIYELLEMNDAIRQLLPTRPTAEAIAKVATATGYVPMVSDGIAKVLAGQTTFSEVLRVTRVN